MEERVKKSSFIGSVLAKVSLLGAFLVTYKAFFSVVNWTVELPTIFIYLMLFFMMLSVISHLYFSFIKRDNCAVLWAALIFSLICITMTYLFGSLMVVSVQSLVFTVSFWAFILSSSYYGVRINKSINIYAITMAICLPLLSSQIYASSNTSAGIAGINLIYYLLFLMPVALLTKSKIVSAAAILLTAALVILSYKRAGMLAIISASIVYYYYENKRDKGLVSRRILGFVVFGGVVVTGFYIFGNLSSTYGLDWASRFQNMFSSGGSGRSNIYKMVWYALQEQDFIKWFTGNGFSATVYKVGEWAHNDFLEIQFNYGILALIAFVVFIVLLVKEFLKMKKSKYPFYPAFALSLVLFFWGVMFSQMVIHPYWFLGLPLFWGITIADYRNMTERKKEDNFAQNI